MRIGIAAPMASAEIAHLLDAPTEILPSEMTGGAFLVPLIEHFLQQGHEVSVYTTDSSLDPRESGGLVFHGDRFRIYFVSRRRHSLRFDRGLPGRMLDFFSVERRGLQKAILVDRPDVVHAHWTYEFAMAALRSGFPCVVTCHDAPLAVLRAHPDFYRFGRLLMAMFVLRRAKFTTVVSPYLLKELALFANARLEVIPNPLADSVFRMGGEKRSVAIGGSGPRIAMVLSRWSVLKNPVPGMLAMKEIREHFPGAVMHLYGEGFGPGGQAESWARSNGCSDLFVFEGWKTRANVLDDLSAMDLLIHPSLEESFGLSVAESLAMGIPAIAGLGIGAIPWLVDDNGKLGGRLVDVRSPHAIADAAVSLLRSPQAHAEAACNARESMRRRFSVELVASAYMKMYERTVADAGRSLPS